MRRTRHGAVREVAAVVTALGFVLAQASPLTYAQGTAKAPAPKSGAVKSAAASEPVDGGWPRTYTTPAGASMTMYQPQVASWPDQRRVVLYAAVSYTPRGAKAPAFGTLKVESDTSVALDQRLVSFSEFKVTESNFPTLSKDQNRDLLAEVTASVPGEERFMALDRVLANIDQSQIIPRNVEGVKADPPAVFFSKTPAILVNIDGDPIWGPITGNDLQFAVNTNWDLFQHAPTKTYYLLATDTWLKATDLRGPWAYAGKLPDSFSKLAGDPNFESVKAALPGKKIDPDKAPRVFVSTTPAELILLRGAPSYVAVQPAGTLLWVSNTESDLFRMGKAGPVYFLVAGRWFSAPDFGGPWTFATPSLPAEFARIPLEHPRSRVLASVPGTQQAAEAVLLAQIPQTAAVKKDLKAPDVIYQGQPEFQPVEKTSVSRAVNTDKDIIKVGDMYYMCFQGVWFMGSSPTGPWSVTSSVPGQIYEIPISSPSYPVTQVTVQESHDDTVVFATALAFTGLMVAFGCAVWGTGYYYPPYVWHGAYPVYYPHYPTYGYGAAYNPWTGSYARGAVAYGPYGGAGVGARYNPSTGVYTRGAAAYGPYGSAAVGRAYNERTGTYARGAVASGPYGSRGAAQAYNPRTGAYGQTRQGSSVYGNWGSTSVQRGDQWASTAHVTNAATGAQTGVARTSQGSAAVRRGPTGTTGVARGSSGDVYAGHDGNVYKKSGDSWQKYDNGNWNTVQQPTRQQAQQAGAQARTQAAASGASAAPTSQLRGDAAARGAGAQRTSAYNGVRSGQRSASSYSPRAARAGGGGRRR
jgi:hypothetical protein